jgi:hypothetical protein
VELMPGEMRVRALKRLVETGEAEGVLSRDAAGEWLIPIKIEAVEDDRAEAIVLSENLDRTDLSAWEWSLAWHQRRESLKGRGQPAGVRDVAASLGKKYQTVGQYLRVADSITPEVLLAAGVVNGSEADHKRMALLPLASLLRVARAADAGPRSAAESLLRELKRAGDSVATARLSEMKARAQARRLEHSGFQINIRQPLGEIAPWQAARYLARMAPALGVLVDRASADLDRDEADELASSLESVVARLRARDP